MTELVGGELKVWYIPQVPGKPFEVMVPDMRTAALVLDVLCRFSLFEFEERIKPDYADASGVARFEGGTEDGGWCDVEEYELDWFNDFVVAAFANAAQEQVS